jgi:ubiquinone/menaquinone biosynthesis C-methylase UbiE
MNADKKKELIAGIYGRSAEGYGDIGYFPVYGERLVEIAGVTPGALVLDVACGRGAVLFPAAERAGAGGRVNGIDISAGMVRETTSEIARRGVVNASAVVMDAEALEFHDDYFDFVLCAFSLQFFTDAVRAVKEFKRVLKPGGKLAVATWGKDDPKWAWWDELMVGTGVSTPLRSRDVVTAEAVRELLAEGGFPEVLTTTEESDHVYPTRREWWNKSWSLSSRVTLERLGEEEMKKLRSAVDEKLDEMEEADGWHEWHEVVYTLAAKGEPG